MLTISIVYVGDIKLLGIVFDILTDFINVYWGFLYVLICIAERLGRIGRNMYIELISILNYVTLLWFKITGN